MTRAPDTKLTWKPPLGPSPAGLGLQVSGSPSCLETKGRILQRMWDGKNLTQENLTQALHKVVHVYRIKEKPKADSDPGLGPQCQKTLGLGIPLGQLYHQQPSSQWGWGWGGRVPPQPRWVSASAPHCVGSQENKVSPSSPGEKGLVPSSRAMGRMGHWPGSPRGQCILNGGSRRGLLKLCSGYLSPTSPHHRRDLRGQLGGLAQSSH